MRLVSYLKTAYYLFLHILRSQWFFYATIFLFFISAGWIALSNSYPLIFDESYHIGIIDIYAQQLSPFITSQPDVAKYYGDITRYPSYLFHYLISFPYRFIGLFTDDIVIKIVILRFINIALVALSLVYWRRVIRWLGLGRAGANIVIFFFTIVPLVSYAAANINYDNLVLLLLPILFLLIFSLTRTQQSLAHLLLAVGLAGVMSVIKFTVLLIILVIAIAAVVILVRRYKYTVLRQLAESIKQTKKPLMIGSVIFAITGIGLFTERFGTNYLTYGSYAPNCIELHSFEYCSEYSVWIRNYRATQSAVGIDRSTLWSPYEFSVNRWFPHIFSDLFISGAFADASNQVYQFMPQDLRASSGSRWALIVSAVAFIIGLVAVVIAWRKFPSPTTKYILMGSFLVYSSALWLTNYFGYQKIGVIFATQGRYMIPFIIPVVAMIILAVSILLRRRPYIGGLLLIVFLLGFIQAAGALTYIVYSAPNWQWDLGYFREWNSALRDVLAPLLKH